MDEILAGATYFACVFGAGVVLGAIRVLFVVPAIGELAAVSMELPLILVWSWIVCGWLLRRFAVPRRALSRVVVGGTAFALLALAETAFPILAERRTIPDFLARYRELPALLGLFGQIAFALIPLRR